MVVNPFKNIYLSGSLDCKNGSKDLYVVHACQEPCYRKQVGTVNKKHPNYLYLRKPYDLYLNIVDPDKPLFFIESFQEALSFMEEAHKKGATILVHCNQGLSRSPSIILLFAAKVLKAVPKESFQKARKVFQLVYPSYCPGKGIETFLTENWDKIVLDK